MDLRQVLRRPLNPKCLDDQMSTPPPRGVHGRSKEVTSGAKLLCWFCFPPLQVGKDIRHWVPREPVGGTHFPRLGSTSTSAIHFESIKGIQAWLQEGEIVRCQQWVIAT